MAIARTGLHIGVNVDGAAAAQAQLAGLQKSMAGLNAQTAAASRGGMGKMFNDTMTVKINNQAQAMDLLAQKIKKGTLTTKDLKTANADLNEVLKYQRQLGSLTADSFKQLANGQIIASVTRGLDDMSNAAANNASKMRQLGAIWEAQGRAIANQGKNMAFMGRQMLLSLTAPIGVAMGATAMAFYKFDEQLTSIVKLSGDSSSAFQASAETIRSEAMELSKTLNETFGASIKDSLDLQGTFAALGKSGDDLKKATESTSRLMLLGDLDTDTAVKFSNTMATVFKASSEEVDKYIDLINEMENSTVLSMQDVSDAMPKIGPIVKAMGGDVEDTLVLLESLKRGGIDAVEGANAVKSITGSLFRPTKKLQLMYQDMVPGDSIAQLIQRNGNKLIDIVKDLGETTADWNPEKKLELFYQLAGKEQAARMLQLSENLAVGNDKVTETLAKSAKERKAIADQEVKDVMSSASKQFDVQLQRALLFLQDIGGKTLPIITTVFSAAMTAAEKTVALFSTLFNALGPFKDMVKWTGMLAIGLAAAAGPFTLIASAYKLLKGGGMMMVGKLAGFMGAKAGGKGFVTAEQRAQQIADEMFQAGQRENTAAVQQLTAAMTGLATAHEKAAVAATKSATANKTAAITNAEAARLAANPALMPTRNTSLSNVSGTLRSDEARLRRAISDEQINRLNSQVGIVGVGTPARDIGGFTRTMPGAFGQTHTTGEAIANVAAQQEKAAASAQKWANGLGGTAVAAGLLTTAFGGTNAAVQTLSIALAGLGTLAMFPASGALASKMFAPILAKGRLAFEALGMIGTNIFTRDIPGAANAGTSKIGRLMTGIGPKIAGVAKSFGPWGIAIAGVGLAIAGIYKLMHRGAEEYLNKMKEINDSASKHAEILGYTHKEAFQRINEETGEVEETTESLSKKYAEMGGYIEEMKDNITNTAKLQFILGQEGMKILSQGGSPADVDEMIEASLKAAGADDVTISNIRVAFSQPTFDATLLGEEAEEQIKTAMNGTDFSSVGDVILDSINPFDGTDRVRSDISKTGAEEIKRIGQNLVNAAASGSPDLKVGMANIYQKAFGDAMAEAIDSGDQQRITAAQKQMSFFMETLTDITGKERFVDPNFKNIFMDMGTVMAELSGETVSSAQATKDYNEALDRLRGKNIELSDEEKVRLVNLHRMRAGLEALPDSQVMELIVKADGTIDTLVTAGDQMTKAGDTAGAAAADVEALDEALGEGQEVDWGLNFTINAGALGMNGDPNEMIDLTLQGYKDAMQKTQDDVFDTASRLAQDNFDSRMKSLEASRDAALDALDKESKALDERHEAEEKAMSKAQEAESKAFDDGWDARLEAEKAAYDARVKAIEDVQEKEDELERQRQRNTEREAARLRYLSGLMNNNIDMNAAIASGDLDQAAKLAINQAQSTTDFQTESADRESGWRKEDNDRERASAIDLIRQEEEERMKMLERQREQERLAMEQRHEIQREEFQRRRDLEKADLEAKRVALQQEWQMKLDNERSMYEINKRRMEDELNTLKATLPRTTEEMMKQKGQIEAIYAQYGVQLQMTGDEWASIVGNRLTVRVNEARAQMSNDRDWEMFGTRVSEGVSRGAFNMSAGEFNHFLRTGEMPGAAPARHNGGPISGRSGDKYDSRGGIPRGAPMQRGETMVLAQEGEFMINKKAHSQLGTGFLNDLNRGVYTRHEGGPIGGEVEARHEGGPIGLGVMGAAMQAAMIGGLVSRAGLAMGNAMMSAVQSGLTSGGFIGEGAAKAAQDFARGETGKPYQYAGVGNPSWDCSGFMGAIWAILTGKNPMQRHFSTETFNGAPDGTLGFKRGLAPDFPNGFSIGLMHGGGGPNSHMAGTLLGLPVEAGGNGVGMGAGYAGANDPQFNDFWHLPGVGGKKPEADPGKGGFNRNYVGWSTPGIEKYGQWAMDTFGYRPGSGAAMGEMLSGNSEFYAKEIVDEAKRRRLSKNAAIIALMTASQESSMLMHANHAVPDSLRYPHDRIGDDHDSIGLFQQRPSMGWGSVAQLMNPRASAGIFYNALTKFNFESMAKGAAAQHVQKSAHPSLYDDDEPRATAWANRYFDMGGLANGKGFLAKGVIEPERVLSPRQTAAFENLVPVLDSFANRGIIGYDDIVTSLRKDNGVLSGSVRAGVAADTGGDTYQISITLSGNINGVDDLEKRMNDMADELVKKLEEKDRMKKRRLGGA